jgi:hypothetical protein
MPNGSWFRGSIHRASKVCQKSTGPPRGASRAARQRHNMPWHCTWRRGSVLPPHAFGQPVPLPPAGAGRRRRTRRCGRPGSSPLGATPRQGPAARENPARPCAQPVQPGLADPMVGPQRTATTSLPSPAAASPTATPRSRPTSSQGEIDLGRGRDRSTGEATTSRSAFGTSPSCGNRSIRGSHGATGEYRYDTFEELLALVFLITGRVP